MIKKNFSLLLILIISAGILAAKVKTVPLNKLKYSDIGHPALAGSVSLKNDALSLCAGGADVWGTRDEFGFSYLVQTGDFDMIALIESLTAPHLYTKAGIMTREELSDNSPHIFFQVFPNNNPRNKNNGGYEFQYRMEKGKDMKAIYPSRFDGTPEFPVNYPNTWIRLKRTGNEFTGFYSADGKSWKPFTTFAMELSKKIYLGLAVTSHNTKETATAVFRDIAIIK